MRTFAYSYLELLYAIASSRLVRRNEVHRIMLIVVELTVGCMAILFTHSLCTYAFMVFFHCAVSQRATGNFYGPELRENKKIFQTETNVSREICVPVQRTL